MSESGKGGLRGLDRKAMEEERLARARKRTGETAELDETTRPIKATRAESTTAPAPPISETRPAVPAQASDAASTSIQYPRGALKRTWASGHPRNNDITFEEVLQASDLTTAVISSWQLDFDFLASKVNAGKTKFIFVLESKSQAEKDRWQRDFQGLEKMVRLCFPPMSGNLYARMHSKLMLLFHPTHLRIVIPSANPTGHDWGEKGGLLENMVFLIDLPRVSAGLQDTGGYERPRFQVELMSFLHSMGMPADVQVGTGKFDFRQAKDLAFIHSIPGTYSDEPRSDVFAPEAKSGVFGLSKAVRSTNCAPEPRHPVEIDIASASLGSLDDGQIDAFARSLRGLPADAKSKTGSQKALSSSDTTLRIIFPSHDTVKRSKGSEDAAGTIFLKSSAFEKPSFPRDLLHDYESTRNGLLSHNKLILVRSPTTAYIYTGSANFSQSAWGRLSHTAGPKTSKATKTSSASSSGTKLTIANWECGVLIPVVQNKPRDTDNDLTVSTTQAGEAPIKTPIPGRDTSNKDGAGRKSTAITIDDSSTESETEGEDDAAEKPPPRLKREAKGDDTSAKVKDEKLQVLPYEVFAGILNIPFKCPPRRYGPREKPWLQ